MDSLNAQMQQLALEEVKNLRFELETLNRAAALKAMQPLHTADKAVHTANVYA